MNIIRAAWLAAVCTTCITATAQTVPSGNVNFGGLSKVSGANIDFYYDASIYTSATVSGDELRLGLQLEREGSLSANQKIIAVAQSGRSLRADVGTNLQGSFNLTPNTSVRASNKFDAYFANYVSGDLVWGSQQTQPVADVTQTYVWDAVNSHYEGDFSSSIYPQTYGSSRPDVAVSALLLNSSFLLSMDNALGGELGSNASVNTVTYSFRTIFPGEAPPVPEPGTYAMLLAGLGILGMLARRRQRH